MVNGINGIGSTTGLDAAQLKDLIKDAVAEEIDTREEEAHKMMAQADEEWEYQPEVKSQEEDIANILTSIFNKLLDTIMAVFGGGNKENVENTEEKNTISNNKDDGNKKYKMSAGEQAYLTMNPDYVENLIAEEKYQKQYGNKNYGLFGSDPFKKSKLEKLAASVTDEEIQAYLQLHQNVIKEAMYKDGINTDDTTINEPKKLNEDEKAYLTMNPDYVRNLISEEKYEEQYGNKNYGLFGSDPFKKSKLKKLAASVTDKEIQAYLQLHPSVIKEAIAKG